MDDAHLLDPRVQGGADGRYAEVVRAFADGLLEPERSGAALAIWRDGEPVVEVWAGVADARTGRPWDAATRTPVFSASKGMAALVVGRLVDDGLDLDQPVADVWPEFGAHGKRVVSIGDAMAHRAGLSAPDRDLGLDDLRDRAGWATSIAAQAPAWAPGTGHAYHAVTFGVIVDEIVRRVTGRDLREIFLEQIAEPLGAEITLSPDAEVARRAAWLTTAPAWATAVPGDPRVARALTLGGAFPPTLVDGKHGFNDLAVRTLGLSAAGGIGTASALARIWSAAVTTTRGVRLLSDAAIAALSAPRSAGRWVYDVPGPYQRWGAGVELSSDAAPMLSARSLGHGGAGGQAAFADPDSGTALGYVRNRLDLVDPIAPVLAAYHRLAQGL